MQYRIPSSPPQIIPVIDTERPLWSVMIPVYNCINYLRETLQSVLLQDPGPSVMQIEVVDDYSTDGDVEKLVKEIGKGRISYYRQKENRGSLRNFETCINRSKGYYVHLLHGDDKVEHGFYKEIATVFYNNPEAGAAFTNYSYIDYKSNKIDIVNECIINSPGVISGFIYKIGIKQMVQPPAMVVKRSTYEKVGSFYAVHFGEDWEMWARIASKFPVAYSPEYLASYRVGHGIGITYQSFLTGQNIPDIKKVINIIQHHLPADKKAAFKKAASAYYAKYIVKIANSLLLHNKDAAFKQIAGAWGIDKSPTTWFWIVRFYMMHILRYKQIENGIKQYASTGYMGRLQVSNFNMNDLKEQIKYLSH